MANEIRDSCQCVLCDKEFKSSSEGWMFRKFSLWYDCIDRIFKNIP